MRHEVAVGGMASRVCAIALGLAIVPVAVTAFPATALAGDESLNAGLQKFEEGRKAYEAGQFEAALAAFKASIDLLPSPNTRLYIGRCYRAIGKTASAYTTLKRAAGEAQDRLTASGEKRYSATRDTANQEAAELEAKVPKLTVAVPSNMPADFAVKVDGNDLPKAAWGIATETDPGDVVVEATGHRLMPFKQKVTLKEGATARVDVNPQRIPTATISVKLKTLPSGLSLTVDGTALDATSAQAPQEVDVGAHTVVVTAPGYLPFKWNKDLADNEGQIVDVNLALDPNAGGGSRGTPKWLFYTVAGVGVAGIGTAAGIGIYGIITQNQQLAMNKLERDQLTLQSLKNLAVVTDVLYGVGGLFAAGAVVLAFTTRWNTEQPSTEGIGVTPWIGATTAGVGAHGSF